MSYIKTLISPERNKNYRWLNNTLLATHKKIMQRNVVGYIYACSNNGKYLLLLKRKLLEPFDQW